MRGVNLDQFDFDYDLTWMAFFLRSSGKVIGRFGGRMPEDKNAYLTLDGLNYALRNALQKHRAGYDSRRHKVNRSRRTVEQYPASKQLPAKSCIHCHHVYDFRREAMQKAGTWKLDEVWVYPLPENVGLTVDAVKGNLVRDVADDSPAQKAGIRSGDYLVEINGLSVATFADVQYALHKAPAKGTIPVIWKHEEKVQRGRLHVKKGWRKTDVSWRWSLRGLQPASQLDGVDLTVAEKKELGLSANRLAFRQGPFVTDAARFAGIEQGDIIIGVDDNKLEMKVRQFDAYMRLNYHPGDRVTINLLRKGKRLNRELELPR